MKKYKKEHYHDVFGDDYDFLLTHDVGLTAVLGCLGYKVYIERKKDTYFALFRIVIKEGITLDINKYYTESLSVNAYALTSNIEILSNIVLNPNYYTSVDVQMKSSPVKNKECIEVIDEKKSPRIDDEDSFDDGTRGYTVENF